MKLTRRARQVAAALAVVFLLVAIWAAYYAYSTAVAGASNGGSTTLADYSELGTNGFVASLRPSILFNNSTEVVGGNVTLYSSLTIWINVTLTWSIFLNRSAAVQLEDQLTVVLSSSVWAKVLTTRTNTTDLSSTTSVTLVQQYAVNVGAVLRLAGVIDNETATLPPEYYLSLEPQISGSISAGGSTQSVVATPSFNLTFDGPLITPGGLSYSGSGSITAPTTDHPTSIPWVPYGLLAASVAALGASLYFATRRPESEPPLPLETLIAPYEEVIAEVSGVPAGEVTLPVTQFADLVKIADTLGKPILRPSGDGGDRESFLVVDGAVAFSYRYPSLAPGGTFLGPPARRRGRGAAFSPSARALVRRLRSEADRMRGLSLDPAAFEDIRARFQRAIQLVTEGEEWQAAREIDELSRILSRAPPRAQRTASDPGK